MTFEVIEKLQCKVTKSQISKQTIDTLKLIWTSCTLCFKVWFVVTIEIWWPITQSFKNIFWRNLVVSFRIYTGSCYPNFIAFHLNRSSLLHSIYWCNCKTRRIYIYTVLQQRHRCCTRFYLYKRHRVVVATVHGCQ